MSDIISQKEIDKLLGVFDDCADKDPGENLITPEILNQNANQKPEVVHTISIYNFKHPYFLNKEQETAVSALFNEISDELSLFYTQNLNRKCKIRFYGFDQITYEEFLRSIPSPSTLCCAIQKNEFFVIEADPCLTEPILNGTNVLFSWKINELTKNLLKTAIQEPATQIMFNHFRLKCKDLPEPQKLWIETNPQFVQPDGITPGSMVGLVTLDVELELENIHDSDEKLTRGIINICMPSSYIKNVLIANKIIPEKNRFESNYSLKQKPGNAYVSLGDFQLRNDAKLYPGLEIPLSTNYQDSINIVDKNSGNIIGHGDICLLDNKYYAIRVCEPED